MDNLEARCLVAPHCRSVPHITRLPFARRILEDNVRGLEYPDRKWMRTVLPDSLKEALQQRRAHHLELKRLGVGNLDRGVAIIFAVEPLEVFFV